MKRRRRRAPDSIRLPAVRYMMLVVRLPVDEDRLLARRSRTQTWSRLLFGDPGSALEFLLLFSRRIKGHTPRPSLVVYTRYDATSTSIWKNGRFQGCLHFCYSPAYFSRRLGRV